ncbi:amino acid adenylation domain-containing protein [Microbispora sp. H13382]|uniref:amino acid adenylation domain-containing protein n=1 Tax=Microbispora sp. H13382 TaxID=2729112 RepID=UPI001C71C85C|nr:amino acid adenylation domain-containing protein [Microbispora sp. H13382]
MFWEQVAKRPQDVAVTGEGWALTYRELALRSARLAGRLRALGVTADDVVGIFVEPSIEMAVGTWGILLAGCGYLPLAPEYPEDRIRYMIEDSRSTVVLTQPHLRERLTDLILPGVRVVALDDAPGSADPQESPAELERQDHPDGFGGESLAYVIYTSGTTGRPKGVAVEHRSIVSQMSWLKSIHGIDEEKTVLRKTPMSFDAAQWEILAVACGSRVVMGPPDVYRDPAGLIETIAFHGVTTLQCVPTLLQALVDDELFQRCTSLQQVFSGGEALSKKLALRCLEVLPGCELVNLYGPTECTINASSYVVNARTAQDEPSVIPIGRPAHGTSFHILDEERSPVPAGGTGELYIGGIQVARGYLHRPDQTAERFVDLPLGGDGETIRLYRTGDLARWSEDGAAQFVGRADNQVKLRGYRVELDEVRSAIENHDWVKSAAVLVRTSPQTGHQSLVACVELNPREAALMDQGNHGAHHQSKESRVQVRAQLANLGLREDRELAGKRVVDMPGGSPTSEQRRRVFARKTYRFFEGGPISRSDIRRLLERAVGTPQPAAPTVLTRPQVGELLRYFGQFHSQERLLPKYGYASPGALYATQLYVEIRGTGDFQPGYYYYHPARHQLVLIQPARETGEGGLRLHFVGKRPAIESVYRNNVLEVLEFETGHMLGLFDEVLPQFGMGIGAGAYEPSVMNHLECGDGHHYLGTFDVVPYAERCGPGPVDTYVQVLPGGVTDMTPGQYKYEAGEFVLVSPDLILKKHVIAINQQVYERAGIGISLISRSTREWSAYIDLGRRLQVLQMNDLGFGFMSSGYSSKTGNDLLSAKRITAILDGCGQATGPSYFFLGGRVSREQITSEGMKEDAVHTKGPAELIKQDIAGFLPDYMVPGRVLILDRLPLSANGKVDVNALERTVELDFGTAERVVVAPRTRTEERVARAWAKVMKSDDVSVRDEFFEWGGNSLLAVVLIQEINRSCNVSLPLQTIFEESTIEGLARRIDSDEVAPVSRLVALRS